MARIISPPRAQHHRLRTPLTVGEQQLLDCFDQALPEEWEIYVQPHLNGSRPDFVLLHPRVGVAVFEVKDWNLNAMDYVVAHRAGSSVPVLYATTRDGKDVRIKGEPIQQVWEYRQRILELYCPRLGIAAAQAGDTASVLTVGVVMAGTTTTRAAKLFAPVRKYLRILDDDPHFVLIGGEVLRADDIRAILPTAFNQPSPVMTEALARDLRSWLVEPDFAAVQREPLELDREQREKVAAATGSTGYRRLRGPAGSGKSLVLAARAARLAAEGKDVLVVSYNITILHYLRDLAIRYWVHNLGIRTPTPGRLFTEQITWLNFHALCKLECAAAGKLSEYSALWLGAANNTDHILERTLPDLTARVLAEQGDHVRKYDAVLVDEGQDFNLDWWNVLKGLLRESGEMFLVADQTQDIYGRAATWTDETMAGAGFRGPWAALEGSYRLPVDLVGHLKRYVREQMTDATVTMPEPIALNGLAATQSTMTLEPLTARWVQVPANTGVEHCVRAVLEMPATVHTDPLTFPDITFLVDSHTIGLRCVAQLEQRNVHVEHIFDRDSRKQRQRKFAFYMGDARVKGATIESFKGWETRALVVHVRSARSSTERARLYVALTRLKRHTQGSFLTVICEAPELRAYGQTWPAFVSLGG